MSLVQQVSVKVLDSPLSQGLRFQITVVTHDYWIYIPNQA